MDFGNLFGAKQEEDGFDMGKMDPKLASQMFQDPAFLRSIASSALKRGLPIGLKWLENAHNAAKENVIEAASLLEADDPDGAIQAFNRSGRFTDAAGAVKNDDGTWTLRRANGESTTVNPTALRKSFLSPKDYFAQQFQERQAKTHEEQIANQGEYQRRVAAAHEQQAQTDATYKQGMIANRDEANRIREEGNQALAAARADAVRAREEGATHRAALNSKYGYTAMYNERLKELASSDVPVADRPAMAHLLTRSSFTQVAPQADGSFAVVDSSGGEPRVLATYPSFEAANAAGQAWVSGKGLPKAGTQAGPASPEQKGAFRRVVDAVSGPSSLAPSAAAPLAAPSADPRQAFDTLMSEWERWGNRPGAERRAAEVKAQLSEVLLDQQSLTPKQRDRARKAGLI